MGETSKFPQGLGRRHFSLGGLLVLIAIAGCANPASSAVSVAASKYAVSYDANGATAGSAPIGSGTYLKGASVTVLGNVGGLAKTGLFFSGWNLKADGSGTGYGAGSRFTMGSSDVKLYAAWTTALVPVTGVSLLPTILNMIAGGAAAGLTATIAPANATNTGVSWASDNPAVATVDGSGIVSPVAAGTATVTATTADGGKTAVCTVNVSSVAVTGVSVHPTTLNMVAGGATGPLTAVFAPANATNKNVAWASNNAGVASVDGSGLVSPVSAGTATITVTTTDGNKTATCAVDVTIPPVALGAAGNYAVLAQSGIDIGATGFVTGDIGVSPIGYAAMTGFGLVPVVPSGSNTLATSALISGNAYASDYSSPTPGNLTAAVTAMHSAYADALGRSAPNGTDLGSGEIGGLIISPGLYKWTTAVTISTNLTLSGGPNDVYIFQVNGALTLGTGISALLPGGALPKNIFWQINGAASLDSNSHFEGVLLSNAAITVGAGATMNSRLLSWTAVTVGTGRVTQPAP